MQSKWAQHQRCWAKRAFPPSALPPIAPNVAARPICRVPAAGWWTIAHTSVRNCTGRCTKKPANLFAVPTVNDWKHRSITPFLPVQSVVPLTIVARIAKLHTGRHTKERATSFKKNQTCFEYVQDMHRTSRHHKSTLNPELCHSSSG